MRKKYAYEVRGTQGKYRRSLSPLYSKRSSAVKSLKGTKKIPAVTRGHIKNLRVKKVYVKKYQKPITR